MITSTQHSSSESTCRSSQRGSSAKKPERNKKQKCYSKQKKTNNWNNPDFQYFNSTSTLRILTFKCVNRT